MKTRRQSIASVKVVQPSARKLAVDVKVVRLLLVTLVFSLSIGTATQASAQSEGSAKGAKGDKKQTNIDFEDELVEGELKKPELFYLLQKKQFNFKRLIKLREDFLPEMRRDGDEIRRGGSK